MGDTTETYAASISPAWVVSGTGVLLLVLSGWHQFVFRPDWPVGATGHSMPALDVALSVFQLVLMLGFSSGLVYGGVWLGRSRFTAEQRWWVLLWFIMGLAGITAVVMLVQFNQLLDGRGVSKQTVIEELLLASGGGGVVGFFTGLTNAQLRRKRAEVAAQRDAFESLNGFLRHNVLNGLQYITGYADLLTGHVTADKQQYLDTIKTQGEQIVFVVQNARTLTRAIIPDDRQTPMDLSTILADEVDTLATKYDHATVTQTGQDGVYVSAGEMLPAVVQTLLCTLIQQTNDDTPSMDVTLETTGETGLVIISGSAIPRTDGGLSATEGQDRRYESTFIRDELGIDLIRQVVRRYGGDVWVDSSETHGPAVTLEIPLAQTPNASRRSLRPWRRGS